MILYRKGNIEDAESMALIYNYYVETSNVIFSDLVLSKEEMQSKLFKFGVGEAFPFLIAEKDGEVIGYAYAHLWMPDPVYKFTWEVTMYLHNQARGMGIGRTLLNDLINLCKEGGAHSLIAMVTDDNKACERMCLGAGFNKVGVIIDTGYKFDKFHDDAIYQLLL